MSKPNKKPSSPLPHSAKQPSAATTGTPKVPAFSFPTKYMVWAGLGIILLLATVIRLQFIKIPMERDEGQYAYYGMLLLEGKVPFVDFGESKLHGIYYTYALLELIFGKTLSGLHVAFLFVNLLTIWLVYRIGKLLASDVAGLLSAGAFALISMAAGLSGFTVQSEHLVALFVSISVLMLVKGFRADTYKYFAFAGLAMTWALMIKLNVLFFVLFGGLAILLYYLIAEQPDWKKAVLYASVYSVAGVLLLSFFCITTLIQGGWDEMIFWTIRFPSTYVNDIPWSEGKKLLSAAWQQIADYHSLFYLSGLGLVLLWFTSMRLALKVILSVLYVISWITISPGYRFYGHYWLQMVPTISLFVGIGCWGIGQILERFIAKPIAYGVGIGVGLLLFISNLSLLSSYYFSPNYTQVLRSTYGMNPFPECMEVAKFLSNKVSPKDDIGMMGYEPQIPFYTDTRIPSQKIFSYYMVLDSIRFPETKQWQRTFIADMERTKPKYFVSVQHPFSHMAGNASIREVYTWFNTFISTNYKPIGWADMISPTQTRYLWTEAEIANYKQQGQYGVLVYERK